MNTPAGRRDNPQAVGIFKTLGNIPYEQQPKWPDHPDTLTTRGNLA
jgi:hypothetical protein